jgi:Coenzyme PQQ synthesis protein D (PqqD)
MMAEKYIARSEAIAARMLGGEMMVMSAADSTFFTLNEVASAIWRAADGRTPLSEIVAFNICQEFEVDREQAQRGADRFVDELSQHGILLVSDRPLTEMDSSPSPEGR